MAIDDHPSNVSSVSREPAHRSRRTRYRHGRKLPRLRRESAGRSKYSRRNNAPMKSRNDDAIPMASATTTMPIKQPREAELEAGQRQPAARNRVEVESGSGMFHSTADEFPRESSRIIPFQRGGAKQLAASQIVTRLQRRHKRRPCLPCAGDEFLRRFARLKFGRCRAASESCSSRSTTAASNFRWMNACGSRRALLRACVLPGSMTTNSPFSSLARTSISRSVFSKCWHGRFDHLPGDRAAVLAVDDVEFFDLQIQDRQRDTEAMALGDSPFEHLYERGAGRRRCGSADWIGCGDCFGAARLGDRRLVGFRDWNLGCHLCANGRSCGRLSSMCTGRRRLGESGGGRRRRPGIARRPSCR